MFVKYTERSTIDEKLSPFVRVTACELERVFPFDKMREWNVDNGIYHCLVARYAKHIEAVCFGDIKPFVSIHSYLFLPCISMALETLDHDLGTDRFVEIVNGNTINWIGKELFSGLICCFRIGDTLK